MVVEWLKGILADLNIAAMVLGYISLLLILGVILHFFLWFLANKRYDRRRKRRQDQEWDEIRMQWIREKQAKQNHMLNTDVLDFTVEQIYDYQKEQNSDPA